MALDSAGYNTANAFSSGNLLATGLQKAAVYDPTTQNSTLSTSVAGKLNSANDSVQDSAPDAQNLTSTQPSGGTLSNASNNTAYPTWSGFSKLVNATGQTANNNVPTSATGPNSNVIGTQLTRPYSPGGSPYSPKPQATAAPALDYNSSTSNGGNSIVSVRTSDGSFAYYQFDTATRSYVYKGSYNQNGQSTYLPPQGANLTVEQRASATLQSLAMPISGTNAGASAGLITQYNQGYINTWADKNTAAQSDAAKATSDAKIADALAYMQANNGQAPQQSLNIQTGQANYTSEQIAAAQAQYQQYVNTRAQEDANAALLGQYANKPIDTAAVDATSQAANNAYASIAASQSGAGLASRLGANNALDVAGQGALNHQTAAAQSYLTNMQAFGEALRAQATTDANATETKLNSDVQNVQDVATALEQNLSQLDQNTQLAVKGQIDNLNNLLAQYQYAMQHYKDNTTLIHNLAIGILAAGGAIATVATGGLAGVAIAAGTAAASTAASKA